METYDGILTRMRQKFSELAGFSADDASDIGIRLKVLAGEVYSLYSGVEWLKRQSFPQTAQQEYLDMLAVQRGLARKQAVPASGSLTFGRSSPLPYDVQIPAGTVCSTAGEEGVRFATLQDAVLPAQQLSVTAAAGAQEGGRHTNAAAGVVGVMMTPPAGIETVVNGTAFTGGADAETDEELRQRLLQSYAAIPNGTNGEFYRAYALGHEGIQSASVKPRAGGSGTVAVYVAAKGAAPAPELVARIQSELNLLREINVDVTVTAATVKSYPFSIYIVPAQGYTFPAAKAAVEQAVRAHFDSLSVGDPVILANLGKAVMDTGLIHNYLFESNISTDKRMQLSELAVADPIFVEELEGAV